MDYNKNTLKKYQTTKINSYIKINTFLLFFLTNKSKNISWKKNEQTLKKLKLTYYKTINKIVLRKFKNSIYKNFTTLISGVILLVTTTDKKRFEKFEKIKKTLQSNFSLISVKLNNKIYSVDELKKISYLSHTQNLFIFYQSLERFLKVNYVFCNKNSK